MLTKEGSTKIENFTTPRAGVLMLGRGRISHFSEYVLSSTLSIYNTLIAIVLNKWIMVLLSYALAEFYLFYDGTVDVQICALLTRGVKFLILR